MISQMYLMIDILSISVPLLASFHPASNLYKRWYALLPAIAMTTILYSVWDSWFVHKGLWGFNPDYLEGRYIGNLPVEEVMFFVCIPYACVFTFDSFANFSRLQKISGKLSVINYLLSGLLLIAALVYHTKYYSAAAFTLLAVLILIANYQKPVWMPRFYVVYVILLIPFIIVNGLLTGTGLAAPVVWYSSSAIMGPRIITIPVEDICYGMGLVLANVWLYEILKKDKRKSIALSIVK